MPRKPSGIPWRAISRANDGAYWPVLSLPDKTPLALDPARWSRMPGCYQLKSAVAWRELAAITGDAGWSDLYAGAFEIALASHESVSCPAMPTRTRRWTGCIPISTFSKRLLPHPEHAGVVRRGRRARARLLSTNSRPNFERADVAAQLLRVQCAAGVDESDCAATAARVRLFQRPDGGYYFGRKAGNGFRTSAPFPLSFAMQALEWYERRESIDCAAVI